MAKRTSFKLLTLCVLVSTTAACSGGGGGGGAKKQKPQNTEIRQNDPRGQNKAGKDKKTGLPLNNSNGSPTNINGPSVESAAGAGHLQVTVGGSMTSAEFNKNQKSQTQTSAVTNQTQVQITNGRNQSPASSKTSGAAIASTSNTTTNTSFDVRIVYSSDLNVSTNQQLQSMTSNEKERYVLAVRKLYEKLDVDGAYRALPVVDSLYETSHVATEKSPYVTASLYKSVVDSGACDINSSGACLVVESDNRNGNIKQRAYYIATSPESPRSRLIRVVRRNLDLRKGLESYAQTITAGTKNQITIFSQVGSLEESQNLNRETYSENQGEEERGGAVSAEEMDRVTDEIVSVMDDSTQSEVAARKAKSPQRPRALAGSCFLGADLKVIRRFIGVMLPKSYIDDAGQKKYKPTKKGKGRLYCYLPDGTRQTPRVEVQVIDRFVSLGWRLSKGSEKFGATGIGWAINGAQDIIAIGSYRYLVSVDSSISNLFWNQLPGLWKAIGFFVRGNITPIIVGGKKGTGGVLATAAGIGLSKNIWSEASVSLFGEITINYDPDDL